MAPRARMQRVKIEG
jgi:hypothetical protein